MVREHLITSAVSFLQNPSVISSPLEQRISFLRSKNLTQEEIDESLARAGDGSAPAGQSNGYLNQGIRQPVGYGYGPYQGPWGPPPEPRRDWRDWFIMATVTSTASYGLYVLAKVLQSLSHMNILTYQRYILPLISPPTPPQLASDKASIDESFSRAFALIEQLAADTAALKSSETERTQKLDSTLQDVESVISDLKAANSRREAESRILSDQVQGLKDLVPKALEGWKASGDGKLDDLGAELRSLKKLVGNRVGSQPTLLGRPYSGFKDKPSSGPSGLIAGRTEGDHDPGSAPTPGVTLKENSTGYQSGRAIPSWQMPASSESSDMPMNEGVS